MRSLCKSLFIAILVASLLNIPAFAAPALAANDKPLGLVTQAQEAVIGTALVAVGTTVYPGDTVETEEGGTLRMKVGGSQVYLLASSAATLSQKSDMVHALVSRGTVGFSSNGTDQVGLEIPEGIVSAANGQPAYGQVTITGPLEVVISAYRGTLVLNNDGELHMIPAGKSYRVTMDLEPAATKPVAQEAAGVGGKDNDIRSPRHRHLVFDLIVLGVAGVGSYFIFREVSESPSTPR
ncbi:MAG: hypothetical protein ABSD87_05085 [Candidatus Acidiferrales bacterium]